jgi:hypothetical protein
MRPVIFAVTLTLSSILGGCIAEPSPRDAWDAHHTMTATHELRSPSAAQPASPRVDGALNRREALRGH